MQNQPATHKLQPNTNQYEVNFLQQNETATFVISPKNTPVKPQHHEDEENRQTINIEASSSEQNRQQRIGSEEEQIEGEVQNEQEYHQHQQQEYQREGQQEEGVGQQQQYEQLNEGLYETLYFQPPTLSDHNQSSKEQNEVSHIQEEQVQLQGHLDQRMESSAQLIEEQREYRSQVQHIYEQEGIQQEWRDQEVIFNYNRTHLSDFTIKNEDYNFVGLSNDEDTPTIERTQQVFQVQQVRGTEPAGSVKVQNNIPPSTIRSQIIKKQTQPQARTQKSSPQILVQAKRQQPLPSNKQATPKASQVKSKPVQTKSIKIEKTKSPTKPEQAKKGQIKKSTQVVSSKKTQIKQPIQQSIPPKIQKKEQQVTTSENQSKKVKKATKKDSPAKKVEDHNVSKPVQKNTQLKQKQLPPTTKTLTIVNKAQPKKQVQKTVSIQKPQQPKVTVSQQPKPKVQGVKGKQQNANRNLRLYYGLSQPIEPAIPKDKEVKVQNHKKQDQIQIEDKKQANTNSNVLLLLKNKGVDKQEQHPPIVQKQEQQPPVKIGKKKKKKKVASSNVQKPKAAQSKESVLPNTDTSLTNFNQIKNNTNNDAQNNDSNRDRHSVIHQSRQPSEPSLPQQRNMVNIINSQLISSVYQSKLPPLTSLTIVKQAEKQRVGTTYKMFLKYTFQYIRTIQNYKRIVSDISIELQRKKVNKRTLQSTLQQHFVDIGKLNREFNEKCYKFQVESQLVSASNNPFANIRLQLKKGFDEMVYLRKSIANNSNRINGYINSHVLPSIKKAFEAYYSLVSQQEVKQYQKRDQHFRRQKIFNKVMSQLDKNFNKGLQGKYKQDLFIEITKFINQQKIHRLSLRNYGRGLINLRQTLIKCEKELFDKLQDIINRFKIEQRSIYSNVRDFNQVLDYTHQIKETTKFIELCTLTDMDYIKYVLEIQNKKETNQFTNRHFQSYLDLVFFDRVVGNIRDMLKGATNKVFPMENAGEELIHSISGNMVLFNRQNDLCKDKYEIKNVNAKIIGAGFVEFDQLLKGFIFDDNRTIRLKLRDEDRAQELICYLNQKEQDIVLQHSRSQVY